MADIAFTRTTDATRPAQIITARFDEVLLRHLPEEVFGEIVHMIVKKFVAENYDSIVASIDREKLSNLIAETVAKKVAERAAVLITGAPCPSL